MPKGPFCTRPWKGLLNKTLKKNLRALLNQMK